MFGYIKPYKPELKIRELDEYNSVYCGLCHQLGRNFSFIARLTLSYDFAFLAMFLMSLEKNCSPDTENCHCVVHPIKSRKCCKSCRALSFSADTAAILTYYKLLDDLSDKGIGHKIRAFFLLPFAKSWRNKAIKSEGMSDIDIAADNMIKDQKKLEEEKCSLSDRAAEPTAIFLSSVLSHKCDENDTLTLKRIGYLIGRYIYLSDAMDDIDDDRKKGNYNPFLFSDGNALAQAKSSLFLTTSELGNDVDLLTLGAYEGIIKNIIHLGLRNEVLRIENKGGCKVGTKPV